MKKNGFEIIAAAQDTDGEKACGEFYEKAKVSFTALIDTEHRVSSLYQMVNVPTGVWIDENGTIVRPPEVAYSKEQIVLGTKIGDNRYIAGLHDWVKRGSDSRFVMSDEALKQRLATNDIKLRKADAHFQLAAYFYGLGNMKEAKTHWAAAQKLHPDNWNYHRQDWSFDAKTAGPKWFAKFRALKGQPYYAPLDLPE